MSLCFRWPVWENSKPYGRSQVWKLAKFLNLFTREKLRIKFRKHYYCNTNSNVVVLSTSWFAWLIISLLLRSIYVLRSSLDAAKSCHYASQSDLCNSDETYSEWLDKEHSSQNVAIIQCVGQSWHARHLILYWSK